jgi:DNA-binding phage protein
MRRLSGLLLAGAMLMPAFSQNALAQDAAAPPAAQPAAQQPAAQKLTYDGDTVIVAYQTNPGKDADYEQVITKLKEALAKSADPNAKAQAAGWTVSKLSKPLQEGGSTYLHVISPVVKGADYSIVNIVYAASNDEEKRAFYELYKGALKGGLVQWNGTTVSSLGK